MKLKREFWSATGWSVILETNGYHGGDGGHGSKTSVQIKALAGVDFSAECGNDYLKIDLAGDDELSSLIQIFSFLSDGLKFAAEQEKNEEYLANTLMAERE